jgi:hypothetical protein
MFMVTYYKFGNRWFLDLPEYIEQGGDEEDLERVGAFHDFLELAAQGEDTVVFQIDTQFFDGADSAVLTGSSGENTGGYYRITSFNDQPVDFELWFNLFHFIKQPELPQMVYFKQINLPD